MSTSGFRIPPTLLAFVIFACLCLPGCIQPPTESPLPTMTKTASPEPALRAGLRSSSYGPQSPFPPPAYWMEASQAMAEFFPDAAPAFIWIVGEIQFKDSSGVAWLNFPAPPGQEDAYPDIGFSPIDKNEAYLAEFDRAGAKVWLQVEPGDTDMLTLIDLILGRYSSHPCVVGFGVDVEWYKWNKNTADEGGSVTDADAQAWSERVRSYNPNYRLFLKHWLVEKMPTTYRTGMLFLDDSQQFTELSGMVDEFRAWGQAFAPSPVGFQFGYEADKNWWGKLADPPQAIGQAILKQIPNTTDLYWVDFTMEQVWPRTP
jgi:hypothetical protein